MKRIDVDGIGIWIEIFKRDDKLTDIEAVKEAEKAIRREVIKRESK